MNDSTLSKSSMLELKIFKITNVLGINRYLNVLEFFNVSVIRYFDWFQSVKIWLLWYFWQFVIELYWPIGVLITLLCIFNGTSKAYVIYDFFLQRFLSPNFTIFWWLFCSSYSKLPLGSRSQTLVDNKSGDMIT